MKPYISLILLLILTVTACSGPKGNSQEKDDTLYSNLEAEMERSASYDKSKEERIAKLRRDYVAQSSGIKRGDILCAIIDEYEAYIADSALYYVNIYLRLPANEKREGEHMRRLIHKADILAHAGLFSDAENTIKSISRESIDSTLLESYYNTRCAIAQYQSEYTQDHAETTRYEEERAIYADSLDMITDTQSFNHLVFVVTENARKGKTEEALKILSDHIRRYPSGSREHSILAANLAFLYKRLGNIGENRKYLVMSAISDLKGSIKENTSFREIATAMYEDGDVERAKHFLRKSIEDSNFYSALLRNSQSAKILPLIDDAYISMQKNLTDRFRNMVIVTSILSVILIVTLLLLLKQFKSLRRANAKVNQSNEELSQLSIRMKEANDALTTKNQELNNLADELRNANRTKEEYAGLFMENCSAAISALQHYQQTIRMVAMKGGSRDELLKKLDATDASDSMLKDFYQKFDEAILHIFPSFVERFNELLEPSAQVTLKSGELLNTDLRLFALIRLGIDDSNQIAQFLRCSLSTVYTYRSKMRKRALHPEDFEKEVKEIASNPV